MLNKLNPNYRELLLANKRTGTNIKSIVPFALLPKRFFLDVPMPQFEKNIFFS